MDAADIVSAWCTRDAKRALIPVDHEIIAGTVGPRTHIVEHVMRDAPHSDFFHACAVLGRIIAARGGSPTLAASTIDGLGEALIASSGEEPDPSRQHWLVSARAALAEGFAAAQRDMARAEATAGWDYPRCAVPIEDGLVAISAGFPDDDGEALAAWAARVANAAARAGVRHVILAGSEAARAALVDALDLVGITPEPRKTGGFRVPWGRR